MPKTKEISFNAETVKVDHQSKTLSVEAEITDVDQLLSEIDEEDLKKYITNNFKADEVFEESDLGEWAIDNDYTKS